MSACLSHSTSLRFMFTIHTTLTIVFSVHKNNNNTDQSFSSLSNVFLKYFKVPTFIMVPGIHSQHNLFSSLECQDMSDFDPTRIFEDDTMNGDIEPCQRTNTNETVLSRGDFQGNSPSKHQAVTPLSVSESNEFINLYVIIDPRTGQMVCPKQVVTFKNGSTTSTAVVGPSFFADAANEGQQREYATNISLSEMTDQYSPNPIMVQSEPSIGLIGHVSSCSANNQTFHVASSKNTKIKQIQQTKGGKQAESVRPVSAETKGGKQAEPLRPLSAYNFFFQAERDKILNGALCQDDDWSEARKRDLLRAHWTRDRSKKRRHRKSHGRISFVELSREISRRWKTLAENHKEFYRQVAATDFARYQREIKEMTDTDEETSLSPISV